MAIVSPRRRSRWGLFIAPVLLLIAAIAWSAFWLFAASQVDVQADAWRAHEAKSGRIYDCAKRSVAGFPFRLEIACDGRAGSIHRRNHSARQSSAIRRSRSGDRRGAILLTLRGGKAGRHAGETRDRTRARKRLPDRIAREIMHELRVPETYLDFCGMYVDVHFFGGQIDKQQHGRENRRWQDVAIRLVNRVQN